MDRGLSGHQSTRLKRRRSSNMTYQAVANSRLRGAGDLVVTETLQDKIKIWAGDAFQNSQTEVKKMSDNHNAAPYPHMKISHTYTTPT